MPVRIDLSGGVFNRLTVVRMLPSKNNRIFWECKCVCGNVAQASTKDLRGKRTQSCGCLRKGPRCRKSLAAKEVSDEEKERRRLRGNAYKRLWYAKNKEKARAQRKAWAVRNPEKRKVVLRNTNLKSNFGITQEDWDRLFSEQDKRCQICKCNVPRGGRWATDHCHTTGKIRGILCMRCNTAIGGMMDNPEFLREAANYVESHARV